MSEASDKLLADFAETIDPTLQEWMNYYERLSSLSSHRASQKHVLCSNSIAAEERAVFNVESELAITPVRDRERARITVLVADGVSSSPLHNRSVPN